MGNPYSRPARGNALEPGEHKTVFWLADELLQQVAFGEVDHHTPERVVEAARDFDVRADVLALLVLGMPPAHGAVFAEDAEMQCAIKLVEEATGVTLGVRVIN